MALDLYVGCFSRYHARQWENLAQQYARETGSEYRIITPDGGPPQAANWDEVTEAVGHWRARMNAALGAHLRSPLDWRESRDTPYFTHRPGYDAYGALLLWAAYTEVGKSPPERYSGEWFSDPVYKECSTPKPGQKSRALLCGALWLPADFEFGFQAQNLTGDQVEIRSNRSLLDALKWLNDSTFRLSPDQLRQAACDNYEDDAPLSDLARFGLAVFHEMAEKSVEHHLPILLDS